jgi:hypothetical protein
MILQNFLASVYIIVSDQSYPLIVVIFWLYINYLCIESTRKSTVIKVVFLMLPSVVHFYFIKFDAYNNESGNSGFFGFQSERNDLSWTGTSLVFLIVIEIWVKHWFEWLDRKSRPCRMNQINQSVLEPTEEEEEESKNPHDAFWNAYAVKSRNVSLFLNALSEYVSLGVYV